MLPGCSADSLDPGLVARPRRDAGSDRLVRLLLTARRRLPPAALGRPAPAAPEPASPERPAEDDDSADDEDLTEEELDRLIAAMEGLLVEIRAGAGRDTMA